MAENSVALYTKYRPKKLSDMIGQDVVVRILTNSFKANKFHHAYIMAGKFGCGKTSAARIIAAMMNCKKGPTLEPCGVCENCQGIFDGSSLDVKEIDAASNRGIDDIRDLKKDAYFAPVSSQKKIVVIDECHSLTQHAAEALLKMIEEPPPNVVIILCTTEPEALKPTIHSRCISLTFKPIAWTELQKHITNVCRSEKIEADEDALKFIAKSSKGSARNSLQSLQTVIDFAGGERISLEIAEKALGGIDESLFYRLVDAIADDKIADGWKAVNELMLKGRNTESIVKGLETYLRDLMLIPLCADSASDLGYTEQEIKRFVFQSKKAKPVLANEMMKILVDVQKAIEVNLDPQNSLCRFVIASILIKKELAQKAAQKEAQKAKATSTQAK